MSKADEVRAEAAADRAAAELKRLVSALDASGAPVMAEDAVTAETLVWRILGTLREGLEAEAEPKLYPVCAACGDHRSQHVYGRDGTRCACGWCVSYRAEGATA